MQFFYVFIRITVKYDITVIRYRIPSRFYTFMKLQNLFCNKLALYLQLLLSSLIGLNSYAQELTPEVRQQLTQSLVRQAVAYEHGEGLPQDFAQAAKLYCDAARYGDAEAQFNLAWMYVNGRGIERNDAYAATLFAMAAAQGHTAAANAQRIVGAPRSNLQPECLNEIEKPNTAAAVAAGKGPMPGEREGWDIDKYLATLPPQKRRIADLVGMLAPQYGVEPRFALAIAVTESNFDSRARSPANAWGVMQLIPATASRFKVRDILDPGQNIRGGLSYLRWLLAYYKGNAVMAAAAYNAGEGAVDRYKGIPPYLETVGYVKRIIAFYKHATHPFVAGIVEPSRAVQ